MSAILNKKGSRCSLDHTRELELYINKWISNDSPPRSGPALGGVGWVGVGWGGLGGLRLPTTAYVLQLTAFTSSLNFP